MAKNKGFFGCREIEGDSIIIIDCYNKKNDIHSFIRLLIEDIWRLRHVLSLIYDGIFYRRFVVTCFIVNLL